MPRRISAHAGSLYRVQSETPYTSTNCHSGVKVSFWRSKEHTPETVCVLKIIGEVYGQVRW